MRVEELTDKQIHHAIAVMQGWVLESGRWVDTSKTYILDDKVKYHHLWDHGTFYHPTCNKSQAFDLLEKYRLQVMFQEYLSVWVVATSDNLVRGVDKALSKAICKAIVRIGFGEEVDYSVVTSMSVFTP